MTLTQLKTKTRRGLTLIETLLALGIAAIVIIGAVAFFTNASGTAKVNDAKGHIQTIISQTIQLYSGQGNYNGVSTADLISAGGAPQTIINGTALVNPWRGQYTLAAVSSNTKFDLTITDIPEDACANLVISGVQGNRSVTNVSVNDTDLSSTNADTLSEALGLCDENNANEIIITAR